MIGPNSPLVLRCPCCGKRFVQRLVGDDFETAADVWERIMAHVDAKGCSCAGARTEWELLDRLREEESEQGFR